MEKNHSLPIILLLIQAVVVIGLILLSQENKLKVRSRAESSTFQYYGAKFALLENHTTLGPLGANTYILVLRPNDSEENWRSQLDAFATKNLKVIVWLWGGGGRVGHAVEWGDGDWDLSKTERFLAFAKRYVSEQGTGTLSAFYGPHEIYNRSKWLEGVGIEQHKRLYSMLKNHFNWPEGVKIFGRIWSDYDADDSWNKEDMEKFSAGVCDLCTIRYTPFRTNGSFLKDKYIADLAHDRLLIQDKGQSKFVPYAPAFAFDNFRMPTAEEMREAGKLACDVKPDGLIWHVWLHSGYSGELRNHPELWPVIGEISDYCQQVAQTTPQITQTITSTPPVTIVTPQASATPYEGLPSPTQAMTSPTPTPACGPTGDIDCSCEVNSLDYNYLVAKYYTDDQKADLDNSGQVNSLDVSILLSNFGKRCPSETTPSPPSLTTTPLPTPSSALAVTPTLRPSPTPGGEADLMLGFGIDLAQVSDYADLVTQGKVTAVSTVAHGNWEEILTEAEKYNLKVLLYLGWQSGGVCEGGGGWSWNGENWKLTSEGEKFLDFYADYVENGGSALLALYTFHEPYNYTHSPNCTTQIIKKHYTMIKNEAAQRGINSKQLPIYVSIDGMTQEDFGPGICDYCGDWYYPNGECSGSTWEEKVSSCLDKMRRNYQATAQKCPECIFFAKGQSFGFGGNYIMPTALEMRDQGIKFITDLKQNYKKPFVFMWHTWIKNAHYQKYFKDYPGGEESFKVLKEVYEAVSSQ